MLCVYVVNIVKNTRLLKLVPVNRGFGGMVANILKEFRATY